jgi:hypothetical protein
LGGLDEMRVKVMMLMRRGKVQEEDDVAVC